MTIMACLMSKNKKKKSTFVIAMEMLNDAFATYIIYSASNLESK